MWGLASRGLGFGFPVLGLGLNASGGERLGFVAFRWRFLKTANMEPHKGPSADYDAFQEAMFWLPGQFVVG